MKQAIAQFVRTAPTNFVQRGRVLPQIKGTNDFTVSSGFILWRRLSTQGVTALQALHSASIIFFWLCSPEVYAGTGDAPFLQLLRRAQSAGEQPWLPTVIHDRAPTAAEARRAVKEYVSESV